LTLRANDAALEMVGAQRWRLVGNDISCPDGHGASACAHGDTALFVKFLGNNVHDAGTNLVGGIAEQKLYHSVYFSTDSNHVEVGWNTIVPNGGGCRALQFHSSPNGAGTGLDLPLAGVHGGEVDPIAASVVDQVVVDRDVELVEASARPVGAGVELQGAAAAAIGDDGVPADLDMVRVGGEIDAVVKLLLGDPAYLVGARVMHVVPEKLDEQGCVAVSAGGGTVAIRAGNVVAHYPPTLRPDHL